MAHINPTANAVASSTCGVTSVAKHATYVAIIAAIAVAIIGGAVYFNYASVAIQGLGTVPSDIAFYALSGGAAVAILGTVLHSVNCCRNAAAAKAAHARQQQLEQQQEQGNRSPVSLLASAPQGPRRQPPGALSSATSSSASSANNSHITD